MAFNCLMKTFAFLSALMSIVVLAASIVVLISAITCTQSTEEAKSSNSTSLPDDNNTLTSPSPLMTNQTGQNNETTRFPLKTVSPFNETTETRDDFMSTSLSSASSTLSNTSSGSDNSTETTAHVFPNNTNDENTESGLNEEVSTTTDTQNRKPWDVFLENQHEFWESKSDTYIILIQASSGTGIFAAWLQLVFSWLLICSAAKDLKARTTLWNLSNFIVLILVFVIILVPLSYNSTNNDFKGARFFWKEISKKITQVEFSSKTLETIWSSVFNFLAKDLTLYYYILGVDAFLLLTLLIPPVVCCFCYPCKKCCCKGNRGRTDSDLMLFGSKGTGGVSNRYSSDPYF